MRKLRLLTVSELQDAIVAFGGAPKKGLKTDILRALVRLIDPADKSDK
jgi:hypothetical protein